MTKNGITTHTLFGNCTEKLPFNISSPPFLLLTISFVFSQILFKMGLFRAAVGWVGAKRPTLPKICHKYHVMMKLGKVIIPYLLKKIQKICKSHDTPPKFCRQPFLHRKSTTFVISTNTYRLHFNT